MQTISITKQDWIAIVKITRPKVNAMNHLFFQEFQQTFSELKSDREVRAVCLLSSLPNVFTAGLDLKQGGMFPGSGGNDAAREAMQFINMVTQMQQAFTSMEQCSKPVVVGVNGACIGGGIDLITAADIRYCSSDAVFSIREVEVGIAADLGTLQRLPRIVKNDSWVRECCLTGRDFGANEAFQFGLVSKVFSSLSELHSSNN